VPTLRPLVFWPHLIVGVSAGVLILTMSVTGVLLTYERQLVAWSDRNVRSSRGAGPRLPMGDVLQRLKDEDPALSPTAVTMAADPTAPVTVTAREGTWLVDAYSGDVLGEGSQAVRGAMTEIRAWHRWLAVEGEGRETARLFTGWANLLFLFIVCSGFYLWLPRTWSWRHVRPAVFFRTGLRGKARDFNWHHVIGVWSLIPLFIVVASALPMSFPWANAALYRIAGDEPPVAGPGRGGGAGRGALREVAPSVWPSAESLNAMWDRAAAQEPGWTTITVRMPASARAPLAFAIDRGNGGQPHLRSTLSLARTGEVVAYETFAGQRPGARLRSLSRFAHTGEALGVAGQTVAGLASAGACVLVWTGLALAVRRCRAWLGRRLESRAGSTAETNAA